MAKRYKIDWEMKGLGSDEKLYLRGLIKTLMRYDVLEQLPRGDQLDCRNKIQELVVTIPFAAVNAEGWSSREYADKIMGVVNEELL